MQEEIDSKTIALVINATKLTGRLLKAGICQFLAHRRNKQTVIPHGKQSVKQLIGQNQGVTTIESNDPDIKAFDKVARKYGVDYAVKKVKDVNGKHKYIIFFKGRDNDAITAAFKEYTARAVLKKPSVLKKLHELGEQVKNKVLEITRNRQRGPDR